MQRYLRFVFFALAFSLSGSAALADAPASPQPPKVEPDLSPLAVPLPSVAPEPERPARQLSVGTKTFDAASVEELFEAQQAENQRRAAEIAPHMNADHLQVFELAPIEADPYHIRNFGELVDKLDPQPRRRLARLAELDPKAAADLHVSMRSEERFFAGEHDRGIDPNAGRAALVDFRTVGDSIGEALKRANQALRARKPTDDQAPVPTGE